MKKIKKIGAMSLGKMMCAIYGLIGLIGGAFVALLSLLGASFIEEGGPKGVGVFLGVGAIVLFPLLYGLMGFIMGIISGWIYNLAAKMFGGVEIELEDGVEIAK